MIFCSHCFKDKEIKAIINGINSKGDCEICGKKNANIYDSNEQDILTEIFEMLLNIYTQKKELPSEFPDSETYMLKDELLNNWEIFNNISSRNVYEIIVAICQDKYEESPELFNNPVAIAENRDVVYKNSFSLLKNHTWEDFKKDIMYNNRFHTDHINQQVLKKICSYIKKQYSAGTIFYRGRISPQEGYLMEEMGAPPPGKSGSGRVNSAGISCLYLANEAKTAIHEIRAGAFDYVTIGKFKLLKDIVIVDLKKINEISPFIPGLDGVEYAINKEHLNKINQEMAKVLRRTDNPIDYVSTQYISDYIKSLLNEDETPLYEGIEYNSTICKSGFNLAVFNETLFECLSTEVHSIKEIKYEVETFT